MVIRRHTNFFSSSFMNTSFHVLNLDGSYEREFCYQPTNKLQGEALGVEFLKVILNQFDNGIFVRAAVFDILRANISMMEHLEANLYLE